jgi:hypothetical protein
MNHLEKAASLLAEIIAEEQSKPKIRKQPIRKGPAPASGLKGVYMDKRSKRWGAKVWANGADKWLGTYDTAEQAAAAVLAFEALNNHLPQSK